MRMKMGDVKYISKITQKVSARHVASLIRANAACGFIRERFWDVFSINV